MALNPSREVNEHRCDACKASSTRLDAQNYLFPLQQCASTNIVGPVVFVVVVIKHGNRNGKARLRWGVRIRPASCNHQHPPAPLSQSAPCARRLYRPRREVLSEPRRCVGDGVHVDGEMPSGLVDFVFW